MQTHYRLLVVSMAFSLACGCSEKLPDGMPSLHPCQITITQEGKPLAGASVRLHATNGAGNAWLVSGDTNSSGTVSMLTQGQYRGAPEGTYKVTVQKTELVSLATPEQIAANEKAKAENPISYDPIGYDTELWQLVEEKYIMAESTTLEMTVSAGKNSATFDVGAAVRVKVEMAE